MLSGFGICKRESEPAKQAKKGLAVSGYCKLFSDIVESSIWEDTPETKVVWITMLALADRDGYIRGSPGWLAAKSRVTKEQCLIALAEFQSPDPRSRTPDNEGRRIEELEDGWLVLNYISFRERLSPDVKALATRERVRKHREKQKALRNASGVTVSAPASASASVAASSESEEGGPGETTPCPPICRTDHPHDWPLELVLSVAALPTVAVLPEMATAFHDHYASIGWQDASQGKRRIVDLAAKLRKWKVDQPSHGKRTQDGRPIVDNSLIAKYGMKREE